MTATPTALSADPGATPASDLLEPRAAPARPARRLDVQGLRALAVLLVVVYHLRPQALPGGFVGVDVFFVISGYLIVGSLAREASTTGVRLGAFYARRVRRLLPAATAVLVAVTAATVLLMPVSRWRATMNDVVTSALQVQNWALAASAGTYGAATESASPLQHYWSLAVEEQFYLAVPVLLLLACALGDRLGWPRRRAVLVALVVLTAASFVHSVTFSASDHDVAYFATTTRVWELGVGGLLAVGSAGAARGPGRALALVAGWVGVAAIAASAVLFTTALDLPGAVAAVPVLGTALVLLSGQGAAPSRGSAAHLLSCRPATALGDVSYSLYLWHWPAVVFFAYWYERGPTVLEGAGLLVATTALAAASTRWVEEPFRRPRPPRLAPRVPRAPLLAVGLVGTSLLVTVLPLGHVRAEEARLSGYGLDAAHPGGADVVPERLPVLPDGAAVVPGPAIARDDVSLTMRSRRCDAYEPDAAGLAACRFGAPGGTRTVVLVGDSHASQFSTVLDRTAEDAGWRMQAMVHPGCPFSAAPARSPNGDLSTCPETNQEVLEQILDLRPDAVVTSSLQPAGYREALGWTWTSRADLVAGYRELWAPLRAAGIPVFVIRDNPFPAYDAPECVARYGPDSEKCSTPRAEVEQDQVDAQVEAAEGLSGVTVVDLTDHYCNQEVCPAVVGGVLVYRDNHLTDSFARSLAPVLSRSVGLI